MDVEPYGSSDLGGDPSDDEPPSMDSSSPSEDEDPEDPEDPKGKKKKKKKKKTRRPEGRRGQEAKAIATSKIVVNLPEFTGKDLSEFAENFGRFLRLTGQTHASGRAKCDLLLQCYKTKYLEKQVRQIVTNSATFADVLVALERQYPTYETDLSIRAEIQNLPVLPNNPKPGRVSELLADLDHWAGRLTPGSYSSDDLLFWLCAKLPRELWDDCRLTAERKARSLRYEDLRRSLPGPAPAVPLPPVTPADLLRINDCIPQFPGSKSKNIEIKSSFNPETATRSHKYSNNPIHNPNQAAGFRSAHGYSHGGGHVQELHQGRKP